MDKKKSKAILEIDCGPRRYIFPHKPGLREYSAVLSIYTADMSRGVFPASLANPGTGKSVACVRA